MESLNVEEVTALTRIGARIAAVRIARVSLIFIFYSPLINGLLGDLDWQLHTLLQS